MLNTGSSVARSIGWAVYRSNVKRIRRFGTTTSPRRRYSGGSKRLTVSTVDLTLIKTLRIIFSFLTTSFLWKSYLGMKIHAKFRKYKSFPGFGLNCAVLLYTFQFTGVSENKICRILQELLQSRSTSQSSFPSSQVRTLYGTVRMPKLVDFCVLVIANPNNGAILVFCPHRPLQKHFKLVRIGLQLLLLTNDHCRLLQIRQSFISQIYVVLVL